MTIAEIATQIGVTPETLVQEVITRGTTKATTFVVLGALAIIMAIVVVVACGICNSDGIPMFGLCTACGLIWIGIMLLMNVPDLVNWKTAPQTTANQYIVEHYGGGQK